MKDHPGDGNPEAQQADWLTYIDAPLERREEAEQGLTTILKTHLARLRWQN